MSHRYLCDGPSVYSLKHAGWYKGEEQFKNDVYFCVHVDGNDVKRASEIAAFIAEALNKDQNDER